MTSTSMRSDGCRLASVRAADDPPVGVGTVATLPEPGTGRALVGHGATVVGGLAARIDTISHTLAIELGGRTIAVIGTPLDDAFLSGDVALVPVPRSGLRC